MTTHRFAVITFEHDIYRGDHFHTRQKSRDIFEQHGYHRMFSDVSDKAPMYEFEDWHVHPELVDLTRFETVTRRTMIGWEDAIQQLRDAVLMTK